MLQVLKKVEEYIFNNDEYRVAPKGLYGCYTETQTCSGELDSSEKFTKPSRTFITPFDVFHYSKTEYVNSKYQLDFSDSVQNKIRASSLNVGDYLYIPFSKEENTIVNSNFKLTPFLFQSKYNFSRIETSLLSELKVPEWFLVKYLTTGVPGNEEYHNLIEIYLLQNKLSIDEFKEKLLSEYTSNIRRNFKITKGFLNLALINLSGLYTLESCTITLKLKDFDDFFVKHILSFLNTNNIRYSLTDINLIVNSSLITGLFIKEFNNYAFLNTLPHLMKKHVLFHLKLFRSVTGKTKSLLYVQDFLKRYGCILSTLSSFDKSQSILYLLKESQDYIKTQEGFLLPILSIEDVSYSSLLQLNIREINDN